MEAFVEISPSKVTQHEGALISLCADGEAISDLYFDFTALLKAVRQPSDTALDLLLVAASVYSLDKLTARSSSTDGWGRHFDVTIPVANPATWKETADTINECVSFLSGDKWRMRFTDRSSQIVRRRRRQRRPRIAPRFARGAVACLFSGGLDSLIGAIDWLEETDDERICLVGHHDPNIGGVEKDQKQLAGVLSTVYRGRCEPIRMGVGHSGKALEVTMRSRSLLFVALGVLVAEHLGEGVPLLIPENGTIALNIPLTPARRGSCSTRTAHPYYLKLLQDWLQHVGLHHPLQNPLLAKTKGEAVLECRNQDVLTRAAVLSNSCAKRGHRSWWVRRDASSCGCCMPCIYRRAALHKVGLDTEVYGNDICTGEVRTADPDCDSADDLRACCSFLRCNHSREFVAKMLIASGPLPPLEVLEHASTVSRAMDEIRQLLLDKGNTAIRNLAGLNVRGNRADRHTLPH